MQSWSVVYGEQPSATKWNILGANDALLDSRTATGWTEAGETWAYATATTITVPTDATTKYNVGDKIRLKQGGSYKYFYVVGVTATLLTITGGTDYTLTNTTITDNYYSKTSSPVGFPGWFNRTPTLKQGASTDIAKTVTNAIFKINGKECHEILRLDATAVGTAGSKILVTTAVTAAYNSFDEIGTAAYFDSGTANYACTVQLSSDGNNLQLSAGSITALGVAVGTNPAITVASGDAISISARYKIA